MPDFGPKPARVAEDIRAQIRRGILSPGQRIPAHRALQEHYRVSSTTIRDAIRILKGEGLIVGQHGEARYVADPLPPGFAVEPVS